MYKIFLILNLIYNIVNLPVKVCKTIIFIVKIENFLIYLQIFIVLIFLFCIFKEDLFELLEEIKKFIVEFINILLAFLMKKILTKSNKIKKMFLRLKNKIEFLKTIDESIHLSFFLKLIILGIFQIFKKIIYKIYEEVDDKFRTNNRNINNSYYRTFGIFYSLFWIFISVIKKTVELILPIIIFIFMMINLIFSYLVNKIIGYVKDM